MLLRHPLRRAALLALAGSCFALVAACSGQVVETPGTGGGHHASSSSSAGGGPTSSSTGGSPTGGFNTPCDGCPWICTDNACVQCQEDSDCDAFGSPGFACQSNHCVCTQDAQCAGNVNGAVCTAGSCGCNASSDCGPSMPACPGPGDTCSMCSSDADCMGSPDGPTCNSQLGCTCADDGQCAGSPLGPHCDASASQCRCQTDADCASSAYGKVCSEGVCSCSKDADCPSGQSCTGLGPFDVSICQ